MTTSSPPAGRPAADAGQLKRGVLGTGSLVFMVVAAAAPLTVMAGVAPLAILVGGVGAPVGYLAAGLVLTVFAVAFTRMTRFVGSAGAFYAYIAQALGRGWGLAAALLALVSYNALQIGVYGLFAAQAQETLADVFGVTVPWPVVAVASVGLVLVLAWLGIDVGAKVLGVLLVLETGILLLMAVGVLAEGGASGLDAVSFTPGAVFGPGMGGVLAFCFAAFMGFESTVLYRKEARDPERTIPRATYAAVAFMALFYCFIVWAVIQAFGSDAAVAAAGDDIAGTFFTVIETYVGPWASTLMHLLVITSVYASQIAFHNAITRYTHALSREGVLPAWVGRVHPRFGSPYRASIVQSVLAVAVIAAFALAAADPYTHLLLWVNTPGVVGVLVLQTLTALAAVVYFTRRNPAASTRTALAAAVASTVLLAVATYVLVTNIELLTAASAGVNAALVGIVPATLLVGAVLAVWLRRRRPATYAGIGEGGGDGPDDGPPDAPDPSGPPARPASARTAEGSRA
ncbi:amino acid/polyamine/organocation transporter (APC superfamily) [Geodermatophilus tzadiensis]|uniref:Amino acid/polyamine/organocation transporter (APC superfamily) n=1 Tax=Geodermatophilus tzadiensis TaxID=1137988 RepID=A0A2T0TWZ5_9ACTN|nr:APC family permease [Geodermatophilus tzadiensis]PRY50191.1 amino acid/polyamine/organocation transporter (APC superfamily) [Geodermatophilus tzadiensis]